MQRYFIYLAYDGTNYHGWQIQPNGSSVQECLMKALSTFLRRDVEVIGAGRTDAGVHASLMVAHFDHEDVLDTVTVADKLNRLLPPDISVYRVRQVKPDAHARFDATARTYKYYVTTAKYPFNRQYRYRVYGSLDYERGCTNPVRIHRFYKFQQTAYRCKNKHLPHLPCRMDEDGRRGYHLGIYYPCRPLSP